VPDGIAKDRAKARGGIDWVSKEALHEWVYSGSRCNLKAEPRIFVSEMELKAS